MELGPWYSLYSWKPRPHSSWTASRFSPVWSQLYPPLGSNCRPLPQIHKIWLGMALQTSRKGELGWCGIGKGWVALTPTWIMADVIQREAELRQCDHPLQSETWAQLDAFPGFGSFVQSLCIIFTFHNLLLLCILKCSDEGTLCLPSFFHTLWTFLLFLSPFLSPGVKNATAPEFPASWPSSWSHCFIFLLGYSGYSQHQVL